MAAYLTGYTHNDCPRRAIQPLSRDIPEHLRVGCDLVNLLFVIDEYTDVEDAGAVRDIVDIVLDAFHNPEKERPYGEVIVGELARQ